MTPSEYRESWAWVHLMLRTNPQAKQALLSYLQDLRTNPNPGPLRPRLSPAFASLEGALHNHLVEIDRKTQPRRGEPSSVRSRVAASATRPTTRLLTQLGSPMINPVRSDSSSRRRSALQSPSSPRC